MTLLLALLLELNFYRALGINSALIKNKKFVSSFWLILIQITLICIITSFSKSDVLNRSTPLNDLEANKKVSDNQIYVSKLLLYMNIYKEDLVMYSLLMHRWYSRKCFDELYNKLLKIDRMLRKDGLDGRYEDLIKRKSVRQIIFILIINGIFSVMTYMVFHWKNSDNSIIVGYIMIYLGIVIKDALFLQFYTVMTILRTQVRQLYDAKHTTEPITATELYKRLEIHELIVATAINANEIFGVQLLIFTMAYFFQIVFTIFQSFMAYQDSVLTGFFVNQLRPFFGSILQLFLEVHVCARLKGEVIAVVNVLEKKNGSGKLLMTPGQLERDFGFSINGYYQIDEMKSLFQVNFV